VRKAHYLYGDEQSVAIRAERAQALTFPERYVHKIQSTETCICGASSWVKYYGRVYCQVCGKRQEEATPDAPR